MTAARVRLRIGRYLVTEAPAYGDVPPGFAVLDVAGAQLQWCATYPEAVRAVIELPQRDDAAAREDRP